jgi:hypothetical protein
MRVINPVTIGVGDLTSNVNITDTAWSAGTYTLGQKRYEGTTLYEVAVASTTTQPSVGVLLDPPEWTDLGAINRWKMFDEKVGTQTTNTTSIDVTLAPAAVVNAVALLNIEAKEALITVTDSVDGEVYRREIDLADIGVADWWEYFFLTYDYVSDVTLTDLPSYSGADINVVLTNTGGTVKFGELVCGISQYLGEVQFGSSVGILDFSRKSTDDAGIVTVEQRAYSKRIDFDIVIDTPTVSAVQRFLAKNRSTALVWIGDDNIEAMIVYGFYRNFSIVLSNPTVSSCAIQVEGLI